MPDGPTWAKGKSSGSPRRQQEQKPQALVYSRNNKEAGIAGADWAKVGGSGSQGCRDTEYRN